MSKVQLGKRPESFAPAPIKFKMPDGSEGIINAVYKYRTRTEYGTFQDSIYAPAVAPAPAPTATLPPEANAPASPPAAPATLNGVQSGLRDKLATHLQDVLLDWDLDQPLGLEALKSLADELPGACDALLHGYGLACTQGRLGN